jgi:3-methyladenine DNA glycosylase AlkD
MEEPRQQTRFSTTHSTRRNTMTATLSPTETRMREALVWLERHGSKRQRDDMAERYAIHTPKAFGVSVGGIQRLAKRLGRDHELAAALWETGWYEARMLSAYIEDPERVTAAQMDRWARDFDNWGICDTLSFVLFGRTSHAWRKVEQWSRRRDEFVKRAAFATLATLALRDKSAGNEPFLRSLRLVEQAATDDRNFVRKGVSWALRAVGERNNALNAAAVRTGRRLAESEDDAARWVGKDVLKQLASPAVQQRLAARDAKRKAQPRSRS